MCHYLLASTAAPASTRRTSSRAVSQVGLTARLAELVPVGLTPIGHEPGLAHEALEGRCSPHVSHERGPDQTTDKAPILNAAQGFDRHRAVVVIRRPCRNGEDREFRLAR